MANPEFPRAGVPGAAPVALGSTMTPQADSEILDWECRTRQGDYHPLEMIPVFRRFPASFTRNIAYTFIWSCALGVLFWLIAIGISPRDTLNMASFIWNVIAPTRSAIRS